MRHRVFYCVLPEDSGMTRTHRIGGVCALALSLLGLPLTTPPAAADPIPIVTVTSGSAILDPFGLGSEFDLHGTEGFSFVDESDDNSGVCSSCAEGETHDFSVRAVATFLATATFQGKEYVFDFNNGGGIFSFQTGSVIMPGQPGTSGTTRFSMPFWLGSESFLRFESNPPFLVALAGSGTLTFLANFTNIPEIGTVYSPHDLRFDFESSEQPPATPEPASLVLMATGAGIGLYRRRANRHRQPAVAPT
jgi:hypothetical protein